MSSPRKFRSLLIGAAASLAVLVGATGCASGDTVTPGDGADQQKVMFLSTQPAGDSGAIDDMIAGLAEVEETGVTTRYLEVTDPSSFESSLRNAAQSGVDVIVMAFPDMTDAITQVAPDFPDTEFVHIFADEPETPIANVTTFSFDVHEAMFISGYVSATLSESGVIGWIGGSSSPMLNANFHAFEAGAKLAAPTTRVVSGLVGSFNDPATGRDIALGMISEGVDVIQTDASGSSLGVIEAAQQRGALVFADASGEVAAEYPATVAGTSFLRFGTALKTSASDALAEGYQASHLQVGLDADVVGLQFSEAFLNGDSPRSAALKDLVAVAADVQEQIISGDLVVKFDPSGI